MIKAFVYGLILAFGLIMPLGIQNIFVFNQGATQEHYLHALPSVFAASLCDTILILVAVSGVSFLTFNLAWLETILFFIGFCFLMYMGWLTWTRTSFKAETIPVGFQEAGEARASSRSGAYTEYVSSEWQQQSQNLKGNGYKPKPLSDWQQISYAVSVSLLNPHALIDSIAVIGVNALHFTGSNRWVFTFGCILVSWGWFLGLSIAGHFVQRADQSGRTIVIVNKVSAIIIWSVGLILAWKLYQNMFP